VERYLASLDWPGNVRQLENTCRWLTVMASGSEIHLDDLPPELREDAQGEEGEGDWSALLRRWAERKLAAGGDRILDEAMPRFEQVLIETALRFSHGRRQDAARLLGWGRNTLTRKIKEHEER
jgi:two-component system nitrogen regulation response regulator GlnG